MGSRPHCCRCRCRCRPRPWLQPARSRSCFLRPRERLLALPPRRACPPGTATSPARDAAASSPPTGPSPDASAQAGRACWRPFQMGSRPHCCRCRHLGQGPRQLLAATQPVILQKRQARPSQELPLRPWLRGAPAWLRGARPVRILRQLLRQVPRPWQHRRLLRQVPRSRQHRQLLRLSPGAPLWVRRRRVPLPRGRLLRNLPVLSAPLLLQSCQQQLAKQRPVQA